MAPACHQSHTQAGNRPLVAAGLLRSFGERVRQPGKAQPERRIRSASSKRNYDDTIELYQTTSFPNPAKSPLAPVPPNDRGLFFGRREDEAPADSAQHCEIAKSARTDKGALGCSRSKV